MRTFNIAVNLPVALKDALTPLPEFGKLVSDKLIDLQMDEVSWDEVEGFNEWCEVNQGAVKKIVGIPLSPEAMDVVAGWDEDCDDSVIGFICSEIVKDLS